tara:strand:+ start:2983 stop:4347 length:1365 start_codon:yes stop_codon:yes gene_type:complete
MAILFLNNIDLSDNQLLNAKLQITGTAPTAAQGQIYFNSAAGFLKTSVHDGTSWLNILDTTSIGNGTFITSTVTNNVDLVLDLSAVNGTAGVGERYLTKNNTWAEISTIPGTYTWTIGAGATTTAVASGSTVTFTGAGTTTTSLVGTVLTITSNDQFTGTVTSVASGNSTFISTVVSGTAVDPILTSSLSASGTPGTTNFLRGDNSWAVVDSSLILTGDVTGSGTNTVATTISAGAVDFAMVNPAVVITESEGIGNNDNDTTLPTTAAVKDYVDSSVAGQLVYQGGYNAATNTPNLDATPTITIKVGFTWTVTADGLFFGEQVRVGDLLIAEIDSPTALTDWTTVQNNIDLADLTTVGIGNVNAGTGIDVAYTSGTATVTNTDTNTSNTATGTITAGNLSGTVTHAFGINTIVQTINSSGDTVFCDVTRTATTSVATISAVEATNITILVQKIG